MNPTDERMRLIIGIKVPRDEFGKDPSDKYEQITSASQRNGLTEQQIKQILSDSACWIGDDCSMPNLNYIIRAVEKAHGIGEK